MKFGIVQWVAVAAIATAAPAAIPASAHAEVMVSALSGSTCIDLSSGSASLQKCNGSAGQNFFTSAYGQQRYNGQCLEGSNGSLRLTACKAAGQPGYADQRWALQSDGQFNNEGGWCVDVPFGLTAFGVQTHQCNHGKNQKWARGQYQAGAAAGVMVGSQAGQVFYGGRMIGASGTPIVAQGGGNIVAQGGGNIVAQGGGNIVVISGGAIVAQGGGN